MRGESEPKLTPEQRRRAQVERQRKDATPEQLQAILRHLLPGEEVLPLVAEAFGAESELYEALNVVILGQPPWVWSDVERYTQFLDVFGECFYGALELRENRAHEVDPEFWDENNEPRSD
jgi:hypothetical protein